MDEAYSHDLKVVVGIETALRTWPHPSDAQRRNFCCPDVDCFSPVAMKSIASDEKSPHFAYSSSIASRKREETNFIKSGGKPGSLDFSLERNYHSTKCDVYEVDYHRGKAALGDDLLGNEIVLRETEIALSFLAQPGPREDSKTPGSRVVRTNMSMRQFIDHVQYWTNRNDWNHRVTVAGHDRNAAQLFYPAEWLEFPTAQSSMIRRPYSFGPDRFPNLTTSLHIIFGRVQLFQDKSDVVGVFDNGGNHSPQIILTISGQLIGRSPYQKRFHGDIKQMIAAGNDAMVFVLGTARRDKRTIIVEPYKTVCDIVFIDKSMSASSYEALQHVRDLGQQSFEDLSLDKFNERKTASSLSPPVLATPDPAPGLRAPISATNSQLQARVQNAPAGQNTREKTKRQSRFKRIVRFFCRWLGS